MLPPNLRQFCDPVVFLLPAAAQPSYYINMYIIFNIALSSLIYSCTLSQLELSASVMSCIIALHRCSFPSQVPSLLPLMLILCFLLGQAKFSFSENSFWEHLDQHHALILNGLAAHDVLPYAGFVYILL